MVRRIIRSTVMSAVNLVEVLPWGIRNKHIPDRVGHSTISTTMDIYGHLFSESQREVAMKFELKLAGAAGFEPATTGFGV